jgi:hypothetical protein
MSNSSYSALWIHLSAARCLTVGSSSDMTTDTSAVECNRISSFGLKKSILALLKRRAAVDQNYGAK